MKDRGGVLVEGLAFALAAALFVSSAALGPPRAAPFEPGPRPPGGYRVVTWNVGGHGPSGAHGLQPSTLPHVASVLRHLEPDLIVLQEVRSRAQAHALLSSLGSGYELALAAGSGSRVAAYARGGRLDTFPIEHAGGRLLGLVHDTGRQQITAVGLHADAFSASARNTAIGAACDALFQRAGHGPRLFLGDFNLDLDLDKRADLFSDDAHLDVETYNYVAAVLTDTALGNGNTAEPDRRLDYVFADPASFRVRAAGPWKGQRTPALDHDPLVADLAWRR